MNGAVPPEGVEETEPVFCPPQPEFVPVAKIVNAAAGPAMMMLELNYWQLGRYCL